MDIKAGKLEAKISVTVVVSTQKGESYVKDKDGAIWYIYGGTCSRIM